MTTLQKTLVATTIAATVITPLVIQQQTQRKLRVENQALQSQVADAESLRAENERLTQLYTDAMRPSGPDDDRAELLRLRGEVSRLRRDTSELEKLRKETAELRAKVTAPKLAVTGTPTSNDIAAAKAIIFNSAANVDEKLAALSTLRTADARSEDVVKEMVLAYYATDNPVWRADIFRQLSGVTSLELKRPLLEAVSDNNQHARVREEAAETLADFLPDPDVKAWLDHLAANDPDEEVRHQAQESLQASKRRRSR